MSLPLIALAIAGCGGGDDDGEALATAPVETTEAPAALSKEELIAQGDAICAEVNAAVGAVGSTSSGGEARASQVADLYGGMADQLVGLGAPSDDSAGYAELGVAAERLAQAQSDAALVAERGEEEALTTAEAEASSALASFQSAASAYGLQRCSEGPSAPPAGAAGSEAGIAEEAPVEAEEEAAPEAEAEEEVAPEAGGAAPVEEESSGGGAAAGGDAGSGTESSGGGSSGGVGPG